MLAAEHYAVEYEGVRELLEIRTREVQHMVRTKSILCDGIARHMIA